MKFLNGGWLVKDGYTVKYAANIYTANIEPGKLTLFCPFGSPIYNPGMTLDGGILTIAVTSPREDIITTRLINFRALPAVPPQRDGPARRDRRDRRRVDLHLGAPDAAHRQRRDDRLRIPV